MKRGTCPGRSRGILLISVLVAAFILTVGIAAIFRMLPAVRKLSDRSKDRISCTLIADQAFARLETQYGRSDGPPVPRSVEEADPRFPDYSYRAVFTEERAGLYRVDLEVTWRREGAEKTERFFQTFRRH